MRVRSCSRLGRFSVENAFASNSIYQEHKSKDPPQQARQILELKSKDPPQQARQILQEKVKIKCSRELLR